MCVRNSINAKYCGTEDTRKVCGERKPKQSNNTDRATVKRLAPRKRLGASRIYNTQNVFNSFLLFHINGSFGIHKVHAEHQCSCSDPLSVGVLGVGSTSNNINLVRIAARYNHRNRNDYNTHVCVCVCVSFHK